MNYNSAKSTSTNDETVDILVKFRVQFQVLAAVHHPLKRPVNICKLRRLFVFIWKVKRFPICSRCKISAAQQFVVSFVVFYISCTKYFQELASWGLQTDQTGLLRDVGYLSVYVSAEHVYVRSETCRVKKRAGFRLH